ncbi:16S rRNA (guanine(527)-N(7))-methyltransferase RsmG, partial [Candidatus Peregrinibacteria bacterium]|nr:16S rRNA (guanine(527)-N(7))-methyltransferase RsmG [Candidatus Peregrinibacteria bacterium]
MISLSNRLREKSQELNLFSTGDREKLETKHIPDALAVSDFWELPDGASVVDLGTGGGLPGLALAVDYPEADFILIDSRVKKVKAVNEVIDSMEIENARAVSGRFEELAHMDELREIFDFAVARAVAPLPLLLEYAAGFLKRDGHFYAWKGSNYEEELKAASKAMHCLSFRFD